MIRPVELLSKHSRNCLGFDGTRRISKLNQKPRADFEVGESQKTNAGDCAEGGPVRVADANKVS
jgi:hypothetical protein